jgi:hypothetical protein
MKKSISVKARKKPSKKSLGEYDRQGPADDPSLTV